MFIIWGTKIRRKPAGFYMDYCPTCREPEVQEVVDVFSVGHLYYIPLGSGKHEARETVCKSCSYTTLLAADADLPLTLSPGDRDTMLAAVPDDIRASWDEAMAREQAIRQDPSVMSPDERLARIVETFNGFENTTQQAIGGDMKVDGAILMKFLYFIGYCIFLGVFGTKLMELGFMQKLAEAADLDGFAFGMMSLMAVGLGLAIWHMAALRPKYLKENVERPLAKTLAPMKPTPDELRTIVAGLKKAKFITAGVNLNRLQEHIARVPRKNA